MKLKFNPLNGRIRQLGLAALLATSLAVHAQTSIYQGHTDIGIDYDNTANEWDLHIHDEVNDLEYSPPSDALLVVKSDAHGYVPSGSEWSFLGTAGSDLWTLPKVQDANLLFLGFGAEEIDNGTFLNDQFTMSLVSVTGPGNITIYDQDSFGNPELWWSASSSGVNGGDRTLPSGTHSHVNWTFSEAGAYTFMFEASATRASDSAFTSSGPVAYNFEVQPAPEPGTLALIGLGVTALAVFRKRK